MMFRKKKQIIVVVALIELCAFFSVVYAYAILPKQTGNESINECSQFVYEINARSSSYPKNEGKKRVVLGKRYSTKSNSSNKPTLEQRDFNEANTIYVFQHDFVLAEDIVMPANCILEFEGGSISGGTIIGNNTSIKAADYSIFNDCEIKKFNLPYVDPRWVGAVPDFSEKDKKGTDNSVFFQRAYDNIAENHPGLDIFIVGKYLINKTVLMRMQCHLKGVHNNTRGYVKRNMHLETGGSSSLIAIGDCAAFRIIGREGEDRTWADLSVEHIKFLGLNKEKSIAIQYEASGAPTRPASIEKCEASNLLYFFYTKAVQYSTLGNLTIRENNIYNCTKAIYAQSENNKYMVLTSLKVENNLIEHNGEKCIHLNGCFGPIIIDNNIIEGQTTPIYLTNTWGAHTHYTVSNNYFENPSADDIKIHIDGAIRKGKVNTHLFLTNVEIFGNTSPFGFEVELEGVVVRRLDRIETPAHGRTNHSSFTNCLFENIDLSDVYASQFNGWNFSTTFPSSSIKRKESYIVETGSEMLSFDDIKGTSHANKLSNTQIKITDKTLGFCLLITKLRPHYFNKSNRVIFKQSFNNSEDSVVYVDFPREIPYYAFMTYEKDGSIKGNDFSAYNEGNDIEVGPIVVYKNVIGALYNYPYILVPFSSK